MKTEIRYGINAIRELLRATGRTPGDIFTEGSTREMWTLDFRSSGPGCSGRTAT